MNDNILKFKRDMDKYDYKMGNGAVFKFGIDYGADFVVIHWDFEDKKIYWKTIKLSILDRLFGRSWKDKILREINVSLTKLTKIETKHEEMQIIVKEILDE